MGTVLSIEEVKAAVSVLEGVSLGTKQDFLAATSALAEIASELTKLEEELDARIRPHIDYIKQFKDTYKERLELLEKGERSLKVKIGDALLKSRRDYDSASKAYQNGELSQEVFQAVSEGRLPEKTSACSCSFKRQWSVKDLDAVPANFKTQRVVMDLNGKAVTDLVNAGEEVPGIEAYEVAQVRLVSRKGEE
jgi:hypothetical protein